MNDIDTLFNRIQIINHKDPPDITPSDIDTLVEFYRHRRTRKAAITQSHGTAELDAILPQPKSTVSPALAQRFRRK